MRRWFLLLVIVIACGLTKNAMAVGVSPSVVEINGNRGEILNKEITVINTNTAATTYYFSTIKFSAQNDADGTPKFIPYSKDHSELPDWIVFRNNPIVVPAKALAKIPFSVAIPNDTPSGSYFAAIAVSENAPEISNKTGTQIQAETAALILLTVNGETKIQGALLDFSANQIDSDQLFGTYNYRLQNQGNVYLKPKVLINFTDIFGRKILETDGNKNSERVLPNTTRTYQGIYGQESKINLLATLKKQFALMTAGPVTAHLEIYLENTSSPMMATTTFWYIPWQMLGIIITVIILIVGIYKFKTSILNGLGIKI